MKRKSCWVLGVFLLAIAFGNRILSAQDGKDASGLSELEFTEGQNADDATQPSEPENEVAPTDSASDDVYSIEFLDGGTLNVRLSNQTIEFESEFGKLSIPTEQIDGIEFGIRISPEDLARIEQYISRLGDPSYDVREEAFRNLRAMRELAYPSLSKMREIDNTEVRVRIRSLLDEFAQTEVKLQDGDFIQAGRSRLFGKIVTDSLRFQTAPFGEVDVKIEKLLALRSSRLETSIDLQSLPEAPENMLALQSKVGVVHTFRVQGNIAGSVWGTKTYTSDSRLSAAAVHAGAVKNGEIGIVRVKVVAAPDSFEGTSKNGVTSSPYGRYGGGAYQILIDAR
jgi:LCCL domain